jgi:Ca2+-binding EF-hand superfamily protein
MVPLFVSLSPHHFLLLWSTHRVDMDGDGKITFEEIIHELTHCIVGTIEEKLKMSVEVKIKQLEDENISSKSSSLKTARTGRGEGSGEGGGGSAAEGVSAPSNSVKVSPNLITYLHTSFQAADTDMNGKLNNTEFWNIIRTVLGLSDGDREILEVQSAPFHSLTRLL